MTLGQSARAARVRLGLNMTQLSRRSGVSIGSLYNIEHDLQVPSVLNAEALASALGITIDEYIGTFRRQPPATAVPPGQGEHKP